jgi:hypothetical protein
MSWGRVPAPEDPVLAAGAARSLAGIALALALALALGCGPTGEEPQGPEKDVKKLTDYFEWSDPTVASGNLDADFADCQKQVAKDPALVAPHHPLVLVRAVIRCMAQRSWRFVPPPAPAAEAK